MGQGLRDRSALLASPLFLGAVALLTVNDHLLKERWPGLVTGKLSDFAGVVVVAVLLVVLTGSRSLAVGLTVVGFVALKTIPGVTLLTAQVLGGTTRRDPTDLVALAVLVPCWRWFAREGAAGRSDVRRLFQVGGGAIALLAIVATPCPAWPKVVGFARSVDGGLVAGVRDSYDGVDRWAGSADGTTWHRIPRPESHRFRDRRSLCLRDKCFRVVPGRSVQARSGDSDWHTEFHYTAEQERRRGLRRSDVCSGSVDTFSSIAIIGSGDRRRVLVGMGSDGVLVRNADGRWARHAVLNAHPVRLDGASWLAEIPWFVLLAGLIVWSVALFAGRARTGHWFQQRSGIVAGLVGLGALFFGFAFLDFAGVDYTLWGLATALGAVIVFVVSVAIGWYDRTRRRA